MPELSIVAAIALSFLIAGIVKGTVGLGLPTISLGLMVLVVELPVAMTLVLVPSFVINVWQAATGGHARETLNRIWPLLSMVFGTVWIGTQALARIDLDLLSGLLGCLLVIHAIVNLAGIRYSVPRHKERGVGLITGVINGVLTGMTGSFTVPGVIYLQAIGLDRDRLIQAMGMLFLVSTVALAAALGSNNLIGLNDGLLSFAALVPAFVGVYAGRSIRQRLSEKLFQRVFLFALLVLGIYIVFSSALRF